MATEMTSEQFQKLTPKERVEWNYKNIDTSRLIIDEKGNTTNLEYYRSLDNTWIETIEFNNLNICMHRIKPEPTPEEIYKLSA